MTSSRRSLTEDAVDRYNHTWGVVLLLTISITTWLIPLIPYIHHQIAEDASEVPRFTAHCWTPAEFTGAMISYAHSACGTAFNQAFKNAEQLRNNTSAALYSVNLDERIPNDGESKRFRPITTDQTTETGQNNQPAMTLIYSRTPLITFILAICLKLPYILWYVFSSCSETGPNQILKSVQAVQLMDAGIRNQTNQEIIKAISSSRQTLSFSSCILYLSFKILTTVVAIIGFIVVTNNLFPATSKYGNGADVSVSQTVNDYSNTIIVCEIPVRRQQNIQWFTFQCFFSLDADSSGTSISPDTAERDFVYIRLYDVIRTILALFFAVLAAINCLNFLVWVVKLAPGPFRNRTFSNTKLPLDAYLLLLLARYNIGFLAAKNLELGFSSEFRGEGKTEEEMRNLTS